MSDILAGKVVVVTGASSGIGRGIALAAARHRAKAVFVADLTDTPREGGPPTVEKVEALGIPGRFLTTDVTRRSEVDALVDATAEFGGVDVMVCNAGITLRADTADVTEDDLHRLMAVNLDGVLFGAQAAGRQMTGRQQPGSIVLMGSMGGLVGAHNTIAYSASKGAVVLMAKALADALGPHDIRVNAVCPGMTDTLLLRTTPGVSDTAEGFRRRTPLRRLADPSEIGNAVAWLGSDLASYVTGIALPVDGGLTAVIRGDSRCLPPTTPATRTRTEAHERKDVMTTPLTTADALTTLALTPEFDVTYLPGKIEELLKETDKPLHRAILKNYLRHAVLEISGLWEQILVPELTVAEPVYRVAERGTVHVLTGHTEVEGFYRQVAESRTNVMAARALNLCVGDFGVVTEAVWNHMTPGSALVADEADFAIDPDAYYLVQHNIIQNFAYTLDAKLIGERVYDDPASYSYWPLDPADVVTPETARRQLAPFLARATLD